MAPTKDDSTPTGDELFGGDDSDIDFGEASEGEDEENPFGEADLPAVNPPTPPPPKTPPKAPKGPPKAPPKAPPKPPPAVAQRSTPPAAKPAPEEELIETNFDEDFGDEFQEDFAVEELTDEAAAVGTSQAAKPKLNDRGPSRATGRSSVGMSTRELEPVGEELFLDEDEEPTGSHRVSQANNPVFGDSTVEISDVDFLASAMRMAGAKDKAAAADEPYDPYGDDVDTGEHPVVRDADEDHTGPVDIRVNRVVDENRAEGARGRELPVTRPDPAPAPQLAAPANATPAPQGFAPHDPRSTAEIRRDQALPRELTEQFQADRQLRLTFVILSVALIITIAALAVAIGLLMQSGQRLFG